MNDRPTPLTSPARLREVLHELRAPLGGIRAMTELLLGTALDPQQREIVMALDASAAHLRAVADGVLGAGEDASAATPRPLGAFLDSLAFGMRLRADARGLSLGLHLADGSLGAIEVGTPGLRQVIENLVDNALRYSSGDVDIVVARRSDSRLQFAVCDHGPGLEREQFERLMREGGGIEGRPGGAGIGLGVCGRIIAEHGGRLDCAPGADGQGTCMTFDWPDGSLPATDGGPQCLVVDDHPASRAVMRTILGAAGYGVIEAADPREALAVFERARPDVVLTDLNMPGGGGQGLITRLTTLMPGVRPRLIVISADEVAPNDPLHALIDAQVRKPISVESVLAALGPVAAGRAA